ncbi:collagen-like protein [Aliifodinibius salicampi]|uniref:Collagen-like protein n=1 Tax=Fodinibius salicampi TaxID=1920655 RepID=A0ABT3Q134_9BACT|nr:hypothetical protein [Fodinibius salicampi]MCW9713815.1 collagen-like protein [Fodinibius salicampi]
MNTTTKRERRQNILKKLLLVALPLALVLGTMAGCEGPQGPDGAQGPQGPIGPEGPVGPAGEDGSVIHAGSGAPSADTGVNGDYYLNQDTGELYGPKNDDGWGTPISLQGQDGVDGQDGADGEDGSQIHSGTSSPDASLGIVGDYYLDKSNFDFYGPKTNSGWGTPINLKGTANVIYSSWTTLDSAVRDTTIDGSDMQVGHIDAPQISQEIIDQGVVNVYMEYSSDIYPLPYTGYAGGATNTMDFLPRLNRLFITRFTHDNSASVGFASSLEYRYVLIPGGVAAKSKISKDQIKKMSYAEVKKRFGIRD